MSDIKPKLSSTVITSIISSLVTLLVTVLVGKLSGFDLYAFLDIARRSSLESKIVTNRLVLINENGNVVGQLRVTEHGFGQLIFNRVKNENSVIIDLSADSIHGKGAAYFRIRNPDANSDLHAVPDLNK